MVGHGGGHGQDPVEVGGRRGLTPGIGLGSQGCQPVEPVGVDGHRHVVASIDPDHGRCLSVSFHDAA